MKEWFVKKRIEKTIVLSFYFHRYYQILMLFFLNVSIRRMTSLENSPLYVKNIGRLDYRGITTLGHHIVNLLVLVSECPDVQIFCYPLKCSKPKRDGGYSFPSFPTMRNPFF